VKKLHLVPHFPLTSYTSMPHFKTCSHLIIEGSCVCVVLAVTSDYDIKWFYSQHVKDAVNKVLMVVVSEYPTLRQS
jgi:hypothetical protein